MNALVAALYAGYALYIVFPFAGALEAFGTTNQTRFGIDLALYAACCAVFYYAFRHFITNGYSRDAWIKAVIGVLVIAFLLALSYHAFLIGNAIQLPGFLSLAFAPNQYFFWWFIAPLVGLLILAR